MASQQNRNNRGGSNRRGNNNRRPVNNNKSNRIQRPIQQKSQVSLNQWIACTSKPYIKKDQTIYSTEVKLDETCLPELSRFISMYQQYQLISLGARFKPASVNDPGLVCTYVMTTENFSSSVRPATWNHQYLKKNGCKATQLIRVSNSPPSVNITSQRGVYSTGSSLKLGILVWCWEGPKFTEDLANVGEFEVYVNIQFMGLK
jgi:hypothetical protein